MPTNDQDTRKRSKKTGTLPADVKPLAWAAEQLGISVSTAYRLAPQGQIPGLLKIGRQWRVSVPSFERAVHGDRNAEEDGGSDS